MVGFPFVRQDFAIPILDISEETHRQVVVAHGTENVYQGQVNTVLMDDGKTLYAVWSIPHGGWCGPMKKSVDGGMTWSGLLPTPEDWRKVRSCPCIFRLTDGDGVERLLVFAGKGELCQSVSEDGGLSWTGLRPNGLPRHGANVTILPIENGSRHLLLTQRDSRPVSAPNEMGLTVWQAISADGGLSWEDYRVACEMPGADPCEPELLRSPDGAQILCLMREETRRYRSLMMTSEDDGRNWSAASELPAALAGDRHMSCYAQDGRLVVAFRDKADPSPTRGSYVVWVGTYEDIVNGREGQYRVKLLHQYGEAWDDCGYSGIECLPDGTIVATTYVKYRPGPELNSIVSVRFTLEETDEGIEARKELDPFL
jgi:hypothetical protein